MSRNFLRLIYIFVCLFIFDNVYSISYDNAKTFEINRLYEDDWSDLNLEEPLRPVRNHFWRGPKHLGHVSGVSVDPSGYPVVFHRADRIWELSTFNNNNVYAERERGPITVNTVLTLNPITGNILSGWGNNTFYLPHGLHIDNFGNVWLTDIALQQVFKYDSHGSLQMSFGKRFVPGNDLEHFCQPTSVAVDSLTGEIFIADGYCNSRIVLFDSMGKPLYSIITSPVMLNIPHSLTILSNGGLCVADRENGRVVGVIPKKSRIGPKTMFIGKEYFIPVPGKVFAVAAYNNTIYTVGKSMCELCANGFTINPYIQRIIDVWSDEFDFKNPHDIAICPKGKSLYVSEIGPNRVWKFDLIKKR